MAKIIKISTLVGVFLCVLTLATPASSSMLLDEGLLRDAKPASVLQNPEGADLEKKAPADKTRVEKNPQLISEPELAALEFSMGQMMFADYGGVTPPLVAILLVLAPFWAPMLAAGAQ